MARETPKKRGIIDRIGDAIDSARGLNVGGAESGRRAKARAKARNRTGMDSTYVKKVTEGGIKGGIGERAPSQDEMEKMIRGGN